MSLMVMAGGLFISLLWLNALNLNEFASKFILSEKVLTMHRLTSGLLFLQLLLMLGLIYALERTMTKKRKNTEGAEPVSPCDSSPRADTGLGPQEK